jgi:hypothetical protein
VVLEALCCAPLPPCFPSLQVLHELQLMYKTTVPGLLLHQANKMKADKAKTFLGVMCEAGITGKVQELYPWAMEVRPA